MKTLEELSQDAIETVESEYYETGEIDRLLSKEGTEFRRSQESRGCD